ncbi:MAG TPA: dienelactone hydrolase family protein [Kofleriaceae bacterium]|nr:dienelactone hydrolase family protein [Kofleriaceae bacterium]
MHTEKIRYRDGEVELEGHLALPAFDSAVRPAVLVCHAYAGQSDIERAKAEALAGLGYVGFAIDLYGPGVLGGTPEECNRLMAPFLDDRAMLRRRLLAGLEAVRGHERVDTSRVAAIGFCFGGLCALDLARSGADLRGVVAFHGLLQGSGLPPETIRARVLALHGWSDPLATPEQVLAFASEMTEAGVDWQLHAYGRTAHAFTNPRARFPDKGLVYDAAADRRSWQSMKSFLAECLD